MSGKSPRDILNNSILFEIYDRIEYWKKSSEAWQKNYKKAMSLADESLSQVKRYQDLVRNQQETIGLLRQQIELLKQNKIK